MISPPIDRFILVDADAHLDVHRAPRARAAPHAAAAEDAAGPTTTTETPAAPHPSSSAPAPLSSDFDVGDGEVGDPSADAQFGARDCPALDTRVLGGALKASRGGSRQRV